MKLGNDGITRSIKTVFSQDYWSMTCNWIKEKKTQLLNGKNERTTFLVFVNIFVRALHHGFSFKKIKIHDCTKELDTP